MNEIFDQIYYELHVLIGYVRVAVFVLFSNFDIRFVITDPENPNTQNLAKFLYSP